MFEKIMSGIISLSMMIFSSYEGNNATFSSLQAGLYENHLTINAKLENAFENDFEEVFKLGKEIHIYFLLEVSANNSPIFEQVFSHKVEFDPLLRRFFVETPKGNFTASDYSRLTDIISEFEYEFTGAMPNLLHVSLTAYLEKLYLPSLEKEYNLMMLWKMRKPAITATVRRGNQ